MMEFHDFGNPKLEAEPSLGWYLQELVQAGEAQTTRHHTGGQAAGVPSGDRSAHEHCGISRVLEYACEIHQVNVMMVVSFEALGRRLQLIEQAHAYSGSKPDYPHGDDFMGRGTGRGRTMVAPGLRRFVADRARERATVLKEMRKQREEQRVRKPEGGKKGGGKRNAGHAASSS